MTLRNIGPIAVLTSAAAAGAAEPTQFGEWPSDTALTLAPGRLTFGLLSQSSWGVSPRVELRLHPLLFWVLPHAEVKLRWLDQGRWQLSSVHRLAYPTPFLSLVSREGSGGLLPATTDVPLALLLDNDVLVSLEWHPGQWASARLGASLAAQGGGDETLLDFPFLYQRFAALNAPVVPRVALSAEGELSGQLWYSLEFRQYWLPLDDFPVLHASEYAGGLYVQLGLSHRMGLGGRFSVARLPVGSRTHFLPHVDYQIAF
jgi:hypothetical protein